MIKIYFNRVSAIIANADETQRLMQQKKYREAHLIDASSNFNSVHFYETHANGQRKTFILRQADPIALLEQFKEDFELVEAAGGLVFNEDGDMLLIFRRGSWDLPKGKMDPGEDPYVTALREVAEETGLRNLKITGKQNFDDLEQEGTYHIYQQNGSNILKLTHWYEMSGSKKDELIPEEREGIERVKWIPVAFLPGYLDNSFLSVKDLAFRYVD